MSRFSIVRGIKQALYVVSGNAARDKAQKEREEQERRQAEWDAEKARAQAEREEKERVERERKAAAYKEQEDRIKAKQERDGKEKTELFERLLKDIYRNRYIILMCDMADVLFTTYYRFKINVLSQEPLLSDEEVVAMFRVAFPHTDLARDWKAGTLRAGGGTGALVNNDDLPPQPLWIFDGKDPHGYWKGANTFPDAFIERLENFLASHPDWYMRNLFPPIADSESVNLSAAVRWYQRRADEAHAKLADR